MGTCTYCGESAGFLHSHHVACEEKHASSVSAIAAAVLAAMGAPERISDLPATIHNLAGESFVSNGELQSILVKTWGKAVDDRLDHGVLTETDEKHLMEIKSVLSLSKEALTESGSFLRVAKSAVIRDLLNGVVPQRLTFEGILPINLLKGEKLVWAFKNAPYLEDRTREEYVGGSLGVSVRVMKGIYVHSSSFRGHPVEHNERKLIDTGWVVLTDKNIYFAGSHKSMRIPYAKIVSFQSFSNGLGIMRDAASAKAQLFGTGDGWFTYNVATNLAKL